MQHSPSAPWRALKCALGLGAAAVASLAFAGAAGAAVIPITPDGSSGTDNLGTAIATANTNSSTSNTIVLAPGIYTPADATTAQPIAITKNLTLVADHTFQTPFGNTPQMEINGANANAKASGDLFQIHAGVNLTVEGMNVDAAGSTNFAAFDVQGGSLTLNGVTMDGSPGYSVELAPNTGASATITNTMLNADQQDTILLGATDSLTLNNVDIIQGANNGIDIQPPSYTLNMNNTLIAFQAGAECLPSKANGGGATSETSSLDDDGTCGVTENAGVDSLFPINDTGNGGPASTVLFPPNNGFTSGAGTNCPTTDERFFPNNGTCDIGSTTTGNTQETSGPSCTVTNNIIGPPKQQQVSLVDGLSGVGPEPGPITDNQSNTPETAYPPPAAGPIPGYSVSNAQINNGTIAAFGPTNPSTSPLVLTATKTNATTTTQWSFTGMNWAGVAKNCF